MGEKTIKNITRHIPFVHLHVHTEYSLLDGACRLKDLMKAARDYRMPTLAITDHGNMFGAIDFYRTALVHGIKPILGYEAYVAPESRFQKSSEKNKPTSYHLTLLAKNQIGYKNLLKLASIAFLEGFYYKPRIDKEVLDRYHEGLIALSGCLKGEISTFILNDKIEDAKRVATEYKNMFGKEDFYLELLDHGMEEEKKINEELIPMGRELGIELVATNDCHYIKHSDAPIHDVLLSIQTATTIDDPKRLKFSTDQFYLKSSQEMQKLFRGAPEAIENTIKIAQKCNLKLKFGETHLPQYKLPEGYSLDEYLRMLSYNGLRRKCPEITPELKERLEYELKVIKDTGYTSYFLIVQDFVQDAKRNRGITIGTGRGSVCSSLVAYALDITDINPLRYNLLFQRFLNPMRVTWPDIDIDIADDRRNEVIEYIIGKYGRGSVAQIVTFGTMKARSAIRDVGRSLKVPYPEVDYIAKLIPFETNMTIEKAIETVPELQSLIQKSAKIKKMINIATALEGIVRHASTHAAGIVIADRPLIDYVPLAKGAKGEIVSQYTMSPLESIGLLKMDLLGLRTLTVINNTIEALDKEKGIKIGLNKIPLNDEKTFQLLREARTTAVFQVESRGFQHLLKRSKPEKFSDLITLVALYRPGPLGSGMVEDFINRKQGNKSVVYLHPILKSILKETYGIIVFQEQITQIASRLANFSIAHADLLRKAIGKKISVIMEEQKDLFVGGCQKNNIPYATATQVFNLIEYFSSYGFSRSHATAYALISYYTAYLKANYPLCYMTAALTSEMRNPDKLTQYIRETRRMGITVLPPDINESQEGFVISGNKIVFGLEGIKNVGSKAIASIIQTRLDNGKFKSFYDFCKRTSTRTVNRRVIESLIKCGAFDSLGSKRSQFMAVLDEVLKRVRKERKQSSADLLEEPIFLPDIEEWPEKKLLLLEKETLGLYISTHSIIKLSKEVEKYTSATTADLENLKDGREITVAGTITAIKPITTKKQKRMAFATLEDSEGEVELVIIPSVYRQKISLLNKEPVLIIRGRISKEKESTRLIVLQILSLEEAKSLPDLLRKDTYYKKLW